MKMGDISAPSWAQDFGHDEFGTWASFAVGDATVKMRWIPPGRFWMGSPGGEEGRWANEGPRHLREITAGFWISDAPCTQALWAATMQTKPSRFPGANRPVENVSWNDCVDFCTRLSALVRGFTARLPREDEWEYACRAGTETPRYGELDAIAWHSGNSKRTTHQVMGRAPNAFGLYDMLGNVTEWCADSPRRYGRGSGDFMDSLTRVVRGGSWLDDARDVRAACRFWFGPALLLDYLGFRLAADAGPEGPPEPPAAGTAAGRGIIET